MSELQEKLNLLKKRIPFQWKIQSITKAGDKAQCVAYIDARDVMDLLDEAVGAENWQDRYESVGGKFIAGIGIQFNGEWVWKYDTGTEGSFEQEKSLFSDAFKRAGVKWGIGRFLYNEEIRWIDVVNKQPVDPTGKRIYDLTEYFNKPQTPRPSAQILQPKEAIEDVSKVCSICKEAISPAVAKYSLDHYGKLLCMKDQVNA